MDADEVPFDIECSFGGCVRNAIGYHRVPASVHPDCRFFVCGEHIAEVSSMIAKVELIGDHPHLAKF